VIQFKSVWGGGDRTKSDTENAQVIDSIKREKRQKHRIRPTEVHGGYTDGRKGLAECRLLITSIFLWKSIPYSGDRSKELVVRFDYLYFPDSVSG
jgi:hypothetical protein